jgi:hypothetical protein
MMLSISVEQASYHSLILRIVFASFALEEVDAALAQRYRDLHSLISKDEVFRTRKKVRNDLQVSQRFVCVADFLVHKSVFPCASNRLQ